jgi:hypothetical protein
MPEDSVETSAALQEFKRMASSNTITIALPDGFTNIRIQPYPSDINEVPSPSDDYAGILGPDHWPMVHRFNINFFFCHVIPSLFFFHSYYAITDVKDDNSSLLISPTIMDLDFGLVKFVGEKNFFVAHPPGTKILLAGTRTYIGRENTGQLKVCI